MAFLTEAYGTISWFAISFFIPAIEIGVVPDRDCSVILGSREKLVCRRFIANQQWICGTRKK